ncbi:uncharacterized protein LOC135378324 [Ornithodoros turicata]|uniref:uncharacterized protein LOC135378324 n=1 Tax=Ornithodoros turicata TaxID=34597 RepID=UPI0031387E38
MESGDRGGENFERRNGYNRRYCCVVHCSNREGDLSKETGDYLTFHRFPGRKKETERRQRWITAVRRTRQDGQRWLPTSNTRICSNHFVGGAKADDEESPSYVPTIFPEAYRKPAKDNLAKTARYARVMKRRNRSVLQGSYRHAHATTSVRQPLQGSLENYVDDFSQPQEDWSGLSDLSLLEFECADDTAANVHHIDAAMDGAAQTDSSTQTEDADNADCHFSVLFAFIGQGCAQTQVVHPVRVSKHTQDTPSASAEPIPGERACVFSGYNSIKHDPDILEDLTSVQPNVFALLLSLLSVLRVRSCDITMENALLLFLMKMKMGISFTALAALFAVHRSTASRIFYRVLEVLTTSTKGWIYTPPPDVRQAMMPECFKLHYPKCKYIIDCTEIKTETPVTVEQQRALFSRYKGTFTLKFLVGIVPSGQIAFVSHAYGGRTSDSEVTVHSKFLDLVEHGDLVLSDKGFPSIRSTVEGKNAILVMPPFASGNLQFSKEEVEDTYCIASVRIHVERAIQRIKVYNILNNRVPVSLIPSMSDIFHICCVLANFQPPIIRK